MLVRDGFFLGIVTGALALAGCGGSVTGTGGGGAGAAGGSGGTAGGSTTGGSGGGGSSTGGSSTGGASTGGSGGSAAMPQCKDAAQCQLVNDCCSCVGLGPGEPAPGCDIQECFVPQCDVLGKTEGAAECAAGQCVAGLPCDWNMVGCDSLPPPCPPGQTATVTGPCWGGCAPADECSSVGGCEQCTGGLACVMEETQLGPVFHCVKPPPACNGVPTCACMGEAVCSGTYTACADSPQGITCSCPDC